MRCPCSARSPAPSVALRDRSRPASELIRKRPAPIGDDVEADVGGAMSAGLMGVLVQTGKYRSGQEKQLDPPPTFVA
ncbi:MAG: HAD hydrolase-like protein [Rhodoblastus sp.]|uniref:HAD hydrolase-like protein n=1 Tax=Rhodoblastus sp. TaxID=1962975 RepID=UPI003F9784D8